MKRILLLTDEFPPFRGGVAAFSFHLASAAAKLGHEITVVAPRYEGADNNSSRDTYPFRLIDYEKSGSESLYSPGKMLTVLKNSWKNTKSSEYDIIHCADLEYLIALATIGRMKRLNFISTIYGSEILRVFSGKTPLHRLLRGIFDSPERFTAISRYTRDLLLKYRPSASLKKITVTYPGLTSDRFAAPPRSIDIRRRYSIPDRGKIILTVARLDERKGHRNILKALGQLPEDLSEDISYLMVGAGRDEAYKNELRRLAEECRAEVRFIETAADDELKALYAGADIFCMPGEPHPRRVEGFGMVYLEAAAQGTPSIASTLGGAPEAVIDGKTGLLVRPGDTPELTDAISRLLRDDDRRRALGRAAREFALEFTWRRCAELTYGT